MIDWLRLNWLKVAAAIASAVVLVLLGAKADKAQERRKRAEDQARDLLRANTSDAIKRGTELQRQAEGEKAKAAEARQKMEARLAKIAERNDSVAAVADRFNARRLRQRTDDTAT